MTMTQSLGRPGQPLPSRSLGGTLNSSLTTHQGIKCWGMSQTPQDSTPTSSCLVHLGVYSPGPLLILFCQGKLFQPSHILGNLSFTKDPS